jgi:hypothetical protein
VINNRIALPSKYRLRIYAIVVQLSEGITAQMSNNQKRVVVAGLGRQGWAVARQLLKLWSGNDRYLIYVYDLNAELEDRLVGNYLSRIEKQGTTTEGLRHPAIKKLRVEGKDIQSALENVRPHLLINASVFTGHEFYTRVAFEVGCDYIDLGQNSWIAIKQRALDQRIREEGKRIRVIPECGLAPGLINILGAGLLQDGGNDLQMRVGGLPIDTHKGGDLHYGLSWSPEGLIQEYMDVTIARKGGRLVSIAGLYSKSDREGPLRTGRGVEPFSVNNSHLCTRLSADMGSEFFILTPQGGGLIQNLEARPTSDGSSLMPFDPSFASLNNLEYKTLRFYPHFDQIEKMIVEDSLEQLRSLPPATPDMVLLRVWTEDEGEMLSMIEGIVLCDKDYRDDAENDLFAFSAMQHLTGWPTALVADSLLNYDAGVKSHSLLREDHLLWSGQSLYSALRDGGVIMPYELVSANQMLRKLDSDLLIPEHEFRVKTNNPAGVHPLE